MPDSVTASRPFEPGTTGWTAGDLEDPRIARQWERGRYEIVEGVLTKMPPAYFAGGRSVLELILILKGHLQARGIPNDFAAEVDLIIDEERVAIADAVWLTPQDKTKHAEAARKAGRSDPTRTRVLVPPTLVIESVSPGHERHDTRTKRRWYAEFGVPNYWLLDAFARSLECLVLEAGAYRIDVAGRDQDEIKPSLFAGLSVPLARLWES